MATNAETLRQLLGERIVAGGTAADTLFSVDEINDFLTAASDDLNLAAYNGWVVKAAELANLVTKAEGNAMEQFSDLHKQALKQIELFAGLAGVVLPAAGRTRVHQITRPNRAGVRQPEA